ncbi:MAG TPA: hypothetical protein VJT14_13780 [Candidatus Dormibacteraeota bacterium]|nr:hypothetical protein [Candidatus Dormibacteraeota bacterium]
MAIEVRRLVRPSFLVFCLYLVLSVLLFGQTWLSPATRLVYGEADVREVTWFMGWTPYALTHLKTPLFTAHIDYPTGVNLMWNTALTVPALVLWPITWAFGPEVSTNAAITLALAVSAWAAYLAARRFVRSRLAAVVAGLVYGFSPLMMSQSPGHIHMTIAFFPPLVLLAFDEILVRRRVPSVVIGAGLGVAGAAQLLIGEEVLALTAIVGASGLAILAVIYRRLVVSHLHELAGGLATGAAVFAVLAAYPLWMQLFGPERVVGVLPDAYANNVLAFLVPTRWQALDVAPGLVHLFAGRNIMEEGGAYVGIPLLILLLGVMIGFWSKGIVRLASIIAIVTALLSMGSHLQIGGRHTRIPLPWIVLEHSPLLKNVAPPRFMLFSYLMIAILVAIFLDWALSRPSANWRFAWVMVAALALLPLFPSVPYPTDEAVTPSFFLGGAVRRIPEGDVVLVAPFSRSFTSEAMMWQSEARMSFRMPEGYAYRPGPTGPTRDPPPSALQTRLYAIYYDLPRLALAAQSIQQMQRDLNDIGAATVVVGPEPREQEVIDLFIALLGRTPEHTGDVYVWWNVR